MNARKIKAVQVLALVVSLFMTVFTPTSLAFQESRGSITGKVTDAQKAVIPDATVKITNVAMGTGATLKTNDEGLFQAVYLIPGTYQVVIEVQGFKKYIRDGVVLRVNDTLALDIQLEVGAVDQSVTVTADAPALETATASLGQVVDSRRVAELPIGHGDPYALIGLAPGVSFTRSQRLDRPFEPTHIVGYSIDGTRANRSDLTIDGTPSTATANPGEVIASYVPPQDLVAEFKVQTATYDAALGNTEGGVTNLTVKSGTNDLHGTLNYTKIWPGLVANDFYGNANLIPRPSFYYNRFGGTVGGPVWVPKVYNGRNKTFFMYGYEGIREARPRNNGVPTVPTEAMKRGDFSALLKLGPQYQIYNPFTRRRLANGRIQSNPFPNNIIPQNLINPVARTIVEQFFPAPRTVGNADGSQNFLRPEMVEQTIYGTHTTRIDHSLSDNHRLFGRASWYDRDSNYNNFFDNISTGQEFQFISRQATIDDVYTFNATTVLNVRYGYNRFIRVDQGNSGSEGIDLTTLGFPAYYNDLIPPGIRRFPRIDFPAVTGAPAPYQGTGVNGEFRPNDTHSASATINKTVGSHAVKWGVEFRSYRENDFFYANNQTGQFNFDSSWTKGPLDNSPEAPGRVGQSFAAFLLGLPAASSFVARPADYAEQSTTWGLYIHDDWKFSPRLTINAGLRYEFETPLTERHNRSVKGFDPSYIQLFESRARTAFQNSQSNPANATPEITQFNVRGGLLFAGDGNRDLYRTPKKNFMPRLGLAFKLDEKTVVRSGYGIFFGFLGQRRGDVIQAGFSQNTPLNVSLDNGLTFIETLSNPFQGGILEPVGSLLGPETFLGQNISFFNPNPLTPYMQRWELSLQRELPGGWVGEAAYVGNRGTHLEVCQSPGSAQCMRNINATPNEFLSTSPTRDQARIDYLSKPVPNPFAGLLPLTASSTFRSSTIARERLLRPFPQFDQVLTTTNEGYSWYHGLQLRLDKRFSNGYTMNLAYTYSKFMEAVELLNAGDPDPTEMISPDDRPHRFSVSGIYEFPFGQGRLLFANAHPVVSKIISGWQITGIYTYQSGPAIGNWGNVLFTGDLGKITLPRSRQTVTQWINTEAGFEKDPLKQLASNVRTFPLRFGYIRADYINNYDFALFKTTRITEDVSLQFRAEFLNAFNTPLLFTSQINLNPTQTAFGSLTATAQENYARRTQFSLKLLF
jgi:carboxypeptidase family protein